MIKNRLAITAKIATQLYGNHDLPLITFRPRALKKATEYFLKNFQAKILYAVKANPSSYVLTHLMKAGIQNFDVASLDEVKIVRQLNHNAELFFMNPIKSRTAIRSAYFDYAVKHYSLDHETELKKILHETDNAHDLHLHVRLAIPNMFSELSLAEKFGVDMHQAIELLKKVSLFSENVGICFHVGSQCMHPDAYKIAIRMAAQVIAQAHVTVKYFNVGGGFPSIYPGMHPPPLTDYFELIHEEFASLPNYQHMQLLCEPGRALVAESGSLITKVNLRKQNFLYLNDGTYGALFDAGSPKFIFPTRLLRIAYQKQTPELQAFHLYGPTCDSLDYMPGPFYLPADIKEGDLIEFGQTGAYGHTLATKFNGFTHAEEIVELSDPPLMSVYQKQKTTTPELQLTA